MTTVDVNEAAANLGKLVAHAESGEEVVITRSGKPIVKLMKCTEEKLWRPGGGWEGKGWISDDFDEPDPEIEKMFDGPIFPDEEEPKP